MFLHKKDLLLMIHVYVWCGLSIWNLIGMWYQGIWLNIHFLECDHVCWSKGRLSFVFVVFLVLGIYLDEIPFINQSHFASPSRSSCSFQRFDLFNSCKLRHHQQRVYCCYINVAVFLCILVDLLCIQGIIFAWSCTLKILNII